MFWRRPLYRRTARQLHCRPVYTRASSRYSTAQDVRSKKIVAQNPSKEAISLKISKEATIANYAEYDKQSQALKESDRQLLKRIGECESGFQMKPNSTGASSAYGIFQLLKVHDKRGDRFTPTGNIQIAIQLFKEQGSTPWNSSKKCWGR